MDHATITRAMHARFTLILTALITLAGTLLSYRLYGGDVAYGSSGFIKDWGSPLNILPEWSLAIAAVINAAIVGLMLHINKTYNLLRTMTQLQGSIFMLSLLATPPVLFAQGPGGLVCLVILWCLSLMYMVYDHAATDMRKVFMVFFLLSSGSTFDYVFVIYMPVFILACLQLRVFSLRCALAIIIGLITPWILLFGFGIITPGDFQSPLGSFSLPVFTDKSTALFGTAILLSVFIAVGALMQNMLKIITYNARSRQMLSVISTLTMVTAVFAIVDITNAYCYLTLLNCCAAFQAAHLFVAIYTFDKSYLAVICIMTLYIILFVCNLVILK